MSDLITLESLDVDGAIRETDAAIDGDTRAGFMKKAAIGGGALIGGTTLLSGFPSIALGKPSKKQDTAILNYALTLEYLEAAFYNQAVKNGILTGEVLTVTKIVQGHENTHVKTLKSVLKGAAVKKPKFDFKNTVTDPAVFLDTAVVLEDTGVSAYAGQGTRILQKPIIVAALSIHSVEARHAAIFRSLNGQNFAPKAFDKAASMKKVLDAVKKTGFIQS